MLSLKGALVKFEQNLKSKNRASATIIAYKKDIEQLVDYLLSIKIVNITQVTGKALAEYIKKLGNEGYTAKTISRKINSTKTFFKYLLEEERAIKTNPAEIISHPKLSTKAPRILTKLEYGALRDAVKSDIRTSCIVEILLQTGLRISEVSNIRISDITIPKEKSKGQGNIVVRAQGLMEEREIPLNGSVISAIEKYLKIRPNTKKDYFFVTKTGNQLLVRNIRATLGKAFKEVGLTGVKVNDLRHTFIAHHLQKGAPLYFVSKIAGHKRLSTTEKYLEYIKVPQKESNIKLEEL